MGLHIFRSAASCVFVFYCGHLLFFVLFCISLVFVFVSVSGGLIDWWPHSHTREEGHTCVSAGAAELPRWQRGGSNTAEVAPS